MKRVMNMQKLPTKSLTIILNEGDLRYLISLYHALKDYMDGGSSDSEMPPPIYDRCLFVLAVILKRAGCLDLIEDPGQTDCKAQRYLM